MLRTELEPYEDGSEERVVLTGPPLELSADLAVPTGMAIHELATNAAICGALSVPSGRVEVVWDVERDAQGKCRLCLEWTEHGGPLSSRPAAGGSGPRCRSGCSRRSAMPRLRWSSTERACAFG